MTDLQTEVPELEPEVPEVAVAPSPDPMEPEIVVVDHWPDETADTGVAFWAEPDDKP